ncbi:hypothetical protein [Dactylosporangium sp. NPDC049140]|uniref:hypothetical protein n=1 Tax=Dactylosporangium sp. NPDC049140 TaxID=3155647 RepID=UPI0033ECDD62
MSASEERGLRLVPGGADSDSSEEHVAAAERLAPRSVRRRAATRRRVPKRRDTIDHVLSHLDEEPVVLEEKSVEDVTHDEDDAGKPPRRRTAPHRRGPARSVRRREPKPRFRLRRPTLATALLALVLGAAIAAAAVLGQRWYDARTLDRAHQQALAAAQQTTVDFVSVSAASVDRDLQRIVAGATGDFRDEFTRGQAQVKAAVVENNVDSKGTVLRSALVSGDREHAVVLVAVDATVRNSKAPEGRASHYRIQVDLARDRDSGRWLVAKLQFVG